MRRDARRLGRGRREDRAADRRSAARRSWAQGFVADTGDFNFLFELYNRNKRGITLDLRIAEGRAAFDRLIEPADVFITNFLPSAREKLRVTPEDLWEVNPRLVYAKGHGQGQQGPDADARRLRRRSASGRAAGSATSSRRPTARS